jgi:hypothetical protein
MSAGHAPVVSTAAIIVALVAPTGVAEAGGFADFHFDAQDNYRQESDSPFSWKLPELGTDFWLEDFEDGALNTLGLSADRGLIRAPGNLTDSVDGDGAGLLDNLGRDGYAWRDYPVSEAPSITFSFDAADLGGLPSMAGLVWTDGNEAALYTFEAFDGEGISLGTLNPQLGDGIHGGSTAADRFLGVSYDGGISAIRISADFGAIELDHIQFGDIMTVPAPSAVGLLGLALLGRRRRVARVS